MFRPLALDYQCRDFDVNLEPMMVERHQQYLATLNWPYTAVFKDVEISKTTYQEISLLKDV